MEISLLIVLAFLLDILLMFFHMFPCTYDYCILIWILNIKLQNTEYWILNYRIQHYRGWRRNQQKRSWAYIVPTQELMSELDRKHHHDLIIMDFTKALSRALHERLSRPRWSATFFRGDRSWNIFSVILSLPLIQEGQLSVSGESMCTILVKRLED